MDQHVVFIFFLIFTGGALLASLALFGRQPLLVAYIALGALLGPFGLGWVSDLELIAQISSIGIVFLLFFARLGYATTITLQGSQTSGTYHPDKLTAVWAHWFRHCL